MTNTILGNNDNSEYYLKIKKTELEESEKTNTEKNETKTFSTEELIKACENGDEDAFNALMQRANAGTDVLLQRVGKEVVNAQTTVYSFTYNGKEYQFTVTVDENTEATGEAQCVAKVDDNAETPEVVLTEHEAFEKAMKDLGLRTTFNSEVFCEQHNPDMPPGDWRFQRHFYWDSEKRVMVVMPGIYYVSFDGHEVKDFLKAYRGINEADEKLQQLEQSPLKDEDVIDDLRVELEEIQDDFNSSNENIINMETSMLEVANQLPSPPSLGAFFSKDGSYFDSEGYAKALTEYNASLEGREDEVLKLELIRQKIEAQQLQWVVCGSNAKDLNNDLDGLLKFTSDDADQTLKEEYINVIKQKSSIRKQMRTLETGLLNETVPTPPFTANYKTLGGELDEDAYNNALIEYQEEMEAYAQKIKEYNLKINNLAKQLTELDLRKNEIEIANDTAKANGRLEKLKQSSMKDENIIKNLEDRLQSLKGSLTSYNTNIAALNRQITELTDEINNTDSEDVSELEAQLSALATQVEMYEEEMKKVYSDLTDLNNILEDLIKLSAYDTEINNLISQLNEKGLTEEADALKAKYEELKNSYTNKITEKNNLNDELSVGLQERNAYLIENPIPNPPCVLIINDDGTIEINPNYEEEKNEYNKQLEEYHAYNNRINNLTSDISIIQDEMNAILREIAITNAIAEINSKIAELKQSGTQDEATIKTIEVELKRIQLIFTSDSSEILSLKKEITEINTEILNLVIPTPPNTPCFSSPEMLAYNEARAKYDATVIKLQKQIVELENQITIKETEIQNANSDFANLNNLIDKLLNNGNDN